MINTIASQLGFYHNGFYILFCLFVPFFWRYKCSFVKSFHSTTCPWLDGIDKDVSSVDIRALFVLVMALSALN